MIDIHDHHFLNRVAIVQDTLVILIDREIRIVISSGIITITAQQ